MECKIYGHDGKPVIVFPSSGGRFYEYEDFRMVDACASFLERGSSGSTPWTASTGRHGSMPGNPLRTGLSATTITTVILLKNSFPLCVIIPAVGAVFSRPDAAWGISLGKFLFRHPDVFDSVIALSGIYDARFFVGEALDSFEVYANSPVDYLAGMEDNWFLERYRNGRIIICTGQGAWEEDSIRHTRLLEKVLGQKSIPAWVDYWGNDVDHDWPWWRSRCRIFSRN